MAEKLLKYQAPAVAPVVETQVYTTKDTPRVGPVPVEIFFDKSDRTARVAAHRIWVDSTTARDLSALFAEIAEVLE